MNTRIVLTGILKDNDELLIVKRSENDYLYPGAWEFPGGHLEPGETLKEGQEFYTNDIAERTYIYFMIGFFAVPFGDLIFLLFTYEYKETKDKGTIVPQNNPDQDDNKENNENNNNVNEQINDADDDEQNEKNDEKKEEEEQNEKEGEAQETSIIYI